MVTTFVCCQKDFAPPERQRTRLPRWKVRKKRFTPRSSTPRSGIPSKAWQSCEIFFSKVCLKFQRFGTAMVTTFVCCQKDFAPPERQRTRLPRWKARKKRFPPCSSTSGDDRRE